MSDRRRNILSGVLMLLALLLATGAIAGLVYNKLRDPKDHYFVRYVESVSGLEVGTTVRMKGVNVGQTESIAIDEGGEGVIVALALEPGTPITEDTRATLTPLGITGLKYIELSGGTDRSRRVQPNGQRSVIPAGDSVLKVLATHGGRIVAKAQQLGQNLSSIANRVRGRRAERLDRNTNRLFNTLERMQKGNSARLKRISRRIDRVTRAMERARSAIRTVREGVGQRLPQARKAALAAARALERAVDEVQLEQTEAAVERAASAARRRAASLSLEGTAATFAAAGRRMARVSEQLTESLERNDAKWAQVKKNLREAGRFIKQLKERYAK